MNEQVQHQITEIVIEIRAKGWRMNLPTKKSWAEIEALGLADYLQVAGGYRLNTKCDAIVKAVLAAAKQAGGEKKTVGGWNPGGDGWSHTETSKPSALYLALDNPMNKLTAADTWEYECQNS